LRFMGHAYAVGRGVPERDPVKAARFFEKAVELGNRQAAIDLAEIYKYGKGYGDSKVKRDYVKAYALYCIGEMPGCTNDFKDKMDLEEVEEAQRCVTQWEASHPHATSGKLGIA